MGDPRKQSKKHDGGAGELDLHSVARSGDVRAVEAICCSNPLSVNSRDRLSHTPLLLAAWAGQAEVVSYLCKHKADIGAAAIDNTGAIHFASQKGHIEVVRILLSAGVSVKAANRKGLTPLHFAAQGSHLELVKYLVKKGADVNAKSKSGQRPKDVANANEVQSYLLECEKAAKKGEEMAKKKKATNASAVPRQPADAARARETSKRKVEAMDLLEPKKSKVALDHLVAEDDSPQEVEE